MKSVSWPQDGLTKASMRGRGKAEKTGEQCEQADGGCLMFDVRLSQAEQISSSLLMVRGRGFCIPDSKDSRFLTARQGLTVGNLRGIMRIPFAQQTV